MQMLRNVSSEESGH